jgi:hypoxanthine phosphoribosyltransferase
MAAHLSAQLLVVAARGNATEAIRSAPARVVTLDVDGLRACGVAKRILVCDDIAGSGATLRAVNAALKMSAPTASVLAATLCCNAGAQPPPDLWIWTVREWVLFPWEPMNEAWQTAVPLPADQALQSRIQ